MHTRTQANLSFHPRTIRILSSWFFWILLTNAVKTAMACSRSTHPCRNQREQSIARKDSKLAGWKHVYEGAWNCSRRPDTVCSASSHRIQSWIHSGWFSLQVFDNSTWTLPLSVGPVTSPWRLQYYCCSNYDILFSRPLKHDLNSFHKFVGKLDSVNRKRNHLSILFLQVWLPNVSMLEIRQCSLFVGPRQHMVWLFSVQ